MPTATKKRPPMENEPGEGKAHEMGESPEEEVREGSESEEGHYGKTNRKRSPRGAKRTKAPMDAEGGCCNEKKGRGKCSACASGKPCGGTMDGDCGMKKRSDALTAPEYLAACDLGIQDMPRPYIRARLDMAQRLDLKCGKGSISQGEKCRKGPATKAQGPSAAVQIGQTAKGVGLGVLEAGKWVSGYNIKDSVWAVGFEP